MSAFYIQVFYIFSIIYFIVTLPAYSYKVISAEGKTLKWMKSDISYKINERGSDDFDGEHDSAGKRISEFDIIKDSFDSWQAVENLNLNIEYKGLSETEDTGIDEENSVIFVEDNWGALPFQPPEVALAVTISSFDFDRGEIFDSDIHFNGEHFDWAYIDSDEEGRFADLQSIATHEIGHFLGLDHSSEDPNESVDSIRNSVMYYSSGLGDTKNRTLKEDDILGIQHLYSLSNDNYPVPEIAEFTPLEGLNNQVIEVTLNGRNFAQNSVVKLTHEKSEYPDIIAGGVTVIDSERIKCTFDLKYAVPGKYFVSVSNTPEKRARVNEKFLIVDSGTSTYYNTSSFYEYSGGGCTLSANPANGTLFFTLILILFPVLFYYFVKRRYAQDGYKLRFLKSCRRPSKLTQNGPWGGPVDIITLLFYSPFN